MTAGGNGGAGRFENYHDDGERGEGCFRRDAKNGRRGACAPLLPGQYENPKEIFRLDRHCPGCVKLCRHVRAIYVGEIFWRDGVTILIPKRDTKHPGELLAREATGQTQWWSASDTAP